MRTDLVPQQAARMLLQSGAVVLRPTAPFRFASGLLSPVYCDNRILISLPRQRRQVVRWFIRLLQQEEILAEVVAGTATAGIPHAAWLAAELRLPMVYVRGQAKGHGREQRVEGIPPAGRQVVVVEDLVTTGGSSLTSVAALRQAGATVEHVLAIFSFSFPATAEAFVQAGVQLHPLTTLPVLLDTAVRTRTLSAAERSMIADWAADPAGWAARIEQGHPACTPSA